MEREVLVAAAALVVGFVACVTDIRSRRVPNIVTFGAAAVALVYHGWSGGANGVVLASGGWLIGLLLFLPFYLLRGMGGGDVKLLAAIGAWLGPREALWLAIYSSIAGGVLAVGVSLYRGYLATAMRNILALVRYWSVQGLQPAPGLTLESSSSPRLAYAIAIFVGTVATIWLQ